MSDPVRLYGGQTATRGECGSCARFHRPPTDPQYPPCNGTCQIDMPPWIKLQHTHAMRNAAGDEWVEGSSADWRRVRDKDSCSFWQASGLTYVKDETWEVK